MVLIQDDGMCWKLSTFVKKWSTQRTAWHEEENFQAAVLITSQDSKMHLKVPASSINSAVRMQVVTSVRKKVVKYTAVAWNNCFSNSLYIFPEGIPRK